MDSDLLVPTTEVHDITVFLEPTLNDWFSNLGKPTKVSVIVTVIKIKKKDEFVILKVHFPRADILLNLWFILYIFVHSNIDMIKTFSPPSLVHSPSHKKSQQKKKRGSIG
jgi:hypothetical protein